jgi:hypothetical protein
MAIINGATPRPDIQLIVTQEMQDHSAFVSHRVFPVFPVAVSTAPIPKILARRTIERLHRPKHGAYPRSPLVVENAGTFLCKDAGFEEPLDAHDIEILGGTDQAIAIAALKATQTLLLARDNSLAASLMTTSTFGSGYNTAGAAAWDNANGKPIDDVVKAAEKVRTRIGLRANTLVISGGAYAKLLYNAQIVSQVKAIIGYTDKAAGISALVSPEILAAAFGMENVIIADAIKNTANEGLDETLGSVWDDTKALVCFVPKSNDRLSPGLGRTFVWEQAIEPNAVARQSTDTLAGLVIEEYDENTTSTKVVRARQSLDQLMLNKDAGHLITGV